MPMTSWERLTKRVAIMHQFWDAAISDLTTEQMNHRERPGVLPIAFSLLHYVPGEDRNVSLYLYDSPMIWESRGWGQRIGGNVPPVRRGTPVDIAESAQIGDGAEWIAYQREVFARTESALQERANEAYDLIVHEDIPDQIKGSFVGMMAEPDGPICLGDVVEGFVFQHGMRHLGEIEHARSLLGLQGVS
jgi:hypothetical protein